MFDGGLNMKKCNKCKRNLPLSAFSMNNERLVKKYKHSVETNPRETVYMEMYKTLDSMNVNIDVMPFQEWENSGVIPKDWKPKPKWIKGYVAEGETKETKTLFGKREIAREYQKQYQKQYRKDYKEKIKADAKKRFAKETSKARALRLHKNKMRTRNRTVKDANPEMLARFMAFNGLKTEKELKDYLNEYI